MAKFVSQTEAGGVSEILGLADNLYSHPMRATRSGPIYNAFPYPTKISPETIGLFIATHTKPGEVVLDCFAGSGMAGVGAILCTKPSESMERYAKMQGLPVQWGPRRTILFEIGVLGSFVAQVLNAPPNPRAFLEAAEKVIRKVEDSYAWLYSARDPTGQPGVLRYIVWSDILRCPSCHRHNSFWDSCVRRGPAEISGTFHCIHCGTETSLGTVARIKKASFDDLLGESVKCRQRKPAWVYGSTNGKSWARPVQPSDLHLIERIESEAVPECVPKVAIPWGDLYRAGYHEGVTHLHHFYTRRNLIAFASLWEMTREYSSPIREALQFWLLSYNASHTTIMTRVVAKKRQKDLAVTSAQPGVLYVSGLPVEKNVFTGLRRKLKTITQAFEITHGSPGLVEVHNASCLSTGLPEGSVDYIFTDPPFGGNIPYGEVNFLNEAWLGRTTDSTEEVIVSPSQGKTVDDYQNLLLQAFREAYRVLRSDGKATVAFHSTSARVWNAFQNACEQAGFGVRHVSILDKVQGSFKQVSTTRSVRGDPLVLLSKNREHRNGTANDVLLVKDALFRLAAATNIAEELTPQRMYSRLVAYYLSCHQDVPIDAEAFYRQLDREQGKNGKTVPKQ